MELLDAYTTLRGKLQRYEEQGWLLPCPETERSRFLAFAEIDLIPLTRRLATVLQQAGIPAHVAVHGDGLGGERLVGFDEIEVSRLPARLLQSHARSGDRA